MTTKANAVPKRLRFGMAEPTSHAPANDNSTSYCLPSTSYFPHSELASDLIPQRHEVPTSYPTFSYSPCDRYRS